MIHRAGRHFGELGNQEPSFTMAHIAIRNNSKHFGVCALRLIDNGAEADDT